MTTSTTAEISEIFSSIQGEGTHLGERHLFLRFEKCHIHCEYCDELDKHGKALSVEEIVEKLQALERESGPHAFVSLTGGEPLLYHAALESLCPQLKREGFRIYLETNGILWRPLANLIPWIDVIAMDVKPASVTKEKSFYNEHRKFLEIAREKEVLVKLVASKELDLREFREICDMISQLCPRAPLILQPISDALLEGHHDADLMRLLSELQRIGGGFSLSVRVIPRLHKILNVR